MELAEIGSRSGTDEAVVDLPDATSCYELNICSLSYKVIFFALLASERVASGHDFVFRQTADRVADTLDTMLP